MLTVVCWKWKPFSGYRSSYSPEVVNVFARMVRRTYHNPVEVVCITDDAEGITEVDRIVPLRDDYADLQNPSDRHAGRRRNPSCYRRLRMFSQDAAEWIGGDRICSMDLDLVLTADITPVLDRPEDFVMLEASHPTNYYNGSMVLFTAGVRPQIWTGFHPTESPRAAKAAGHWGSDQAWIGHCLGPDEAKFTKKNGVYCYRKDVAPKGGLLPADARIVFFNGHRDPWSPEVQDSTPWVRDLWR